MVITNYLCSIRFYVSELHHDVIAIYGVKYVYIYLYLISHKSVKCVKK